jgi:hypothetical protein
MFLDVNDEFSGIAADFARIDFSRPTITVRDLIRERVRLELERIEAQRKLGSYAVTPTPEEQRLNTACRPSPLADAMLADAVLGEDDAEAEAAHGQRQIRVAEQGFEQGRYYVLLDDRQADSLDQVINLASVKQATFLLLTPLRGG